MKIAIGQYLRRTPTAWIESRRAFSLWPGIIFAVIALTACILGITVYLAHSDRSFAIEPNYDQQALEWNQTRHQTEMNTALGWNMEMDIDRGSQANQNRFVVR